MVFKLLIERISISIVLIDRRYSAIIKGATHHPTGNSLHSTLNPPTIGDTETRNAVQCALHATGTGGLKGRSWGVEP